MLFFIFNKLNSILQSKKSIILSLGNVPGLILISTTFNLSNSNNREDIILNADYS
jgi:hypothetical protein